MKNDIVSSAPIRDKEKRRRLCDLGITKNNRIVIIDVERDRYGHKEELIGDITDHVVMLSKLINK